MTHELPLKRSIATGRLRAGSGGVMTGGTQNTITRRGVLPDGESRSAPGDRRLCPSLGPGATSRRADVRSLQKMREGAAVHWGDELPHREGFEPKEVVGARKLTARTAAPYDGKRPFRVVSWFVGT